MPDGLTVARPKVGGTFMGGGARRPGMRAGESESQFVKRKKIEVDRGYLRGLLG